jgi:large subunit ribosomal protein L3
MDPRFKSGRPGQPFALLGRKLGMTQVFNEAGDVVPVTVVEVGPCVVLQKKTQATDGYNAIQIGFSDRKKQNVTKPQAGHAAASSQVAKRFIREVRMDEESINNYNVGQILKADLLKEGDRLDVIATSKGKGYAGVMKRWNFRGQKSSHNHEFFRHGGSIGNRSDPGKVFKLKKMPGQLGNERVTVQNLRVFKIEADKNVVLIRGAVPGAINGFVTLKASVKGGFEPRTAAT